ncbi:hypothetical protein GGF32_001132 [Allomyces javanicus]|nr:hypothetical protein GGF32_001132 [Allomyces javanicus]
MLQIRSASKMQTDQRIQIEYEQGSTDELHRTERRCEFKRRQYRENAEERRLVRQERELRREIARDLDEIQREVQQVEDEHVQAVDKVEKLEKERDKFNDVLELLQQQWE